MVRPVNATPNHMTTNESLLVLLRARCALVLALAASKCARDGIAPATGVAGGTSGSAPEAGWSSPTLVPGAQGSIVARSPSLAPFGAAAYLVGNTISQFDTSVVSASPLVAVRLPSTDVGRPDGQWTFAYPRAGVDARGHLHLLWGERAHPTVLMTAQEWPGDLTSIWHSELTPTGIWSKPTALVTGAHDIDWDADRLGDLHPSSGHRLVLAVVITERSGQAAPVLLVHEGARWATRPVAPRAVVRYVAAAAVGQRIYVGAIEFADSSLSRQLVTLRYSDDAGLAWSARSIVSEIQGGDRASELRTLAGPDGRPYVTWIETSAGRRSRLRLAAPGQNAGGVGVTNGLELTYRVQSLRAVIGPGGDVLFAFEHWDGGGLDGRTGHIDYVEWGGRWSPVAHLFSGFDPASPAIAVAEDGRPMLVFLGRAQACTSQAGSCTYVSRGPRRQIKGPTP